MVGMVYTCFPLSPSTYSSFHCSLACQIPSVTFLALALLPPGSSSFLPSLTSGHHCPVVSSLFGTLILLSLSSFNMGAPFHCFLTFSHPPYMCSSVVASTLCDLMTHPGLSFPLACKPFFPKPAFTFSVCYQTKCVYTEFCIHPSKHGPPAFLLIGCSALKEITSLFLLILPIVCLPAQWIVSPVFLLPAEILCPHSDCLC